MTTKHDNGQGTTGPSGTNSHRTSHQPAFSVVHYDNTVYDYAAVHDFFSPWF